MAEAAQSTSESLRKAGNELYKQNKLDQAVIQYKRAAESDPSDPAPFSNLSATYFELGDYEKSIEATKSALALNGGGNPERAQKLKIRLAREAREAAEEVPQGKDRDGLLASLQSCPIGSQSDLEVASSRAKAINLLPRYKPHLLSTTQYYSFGHDAPEGLIDSQLAIHYSSMKRISMFFGGIGDARNLYMTLLEANSVEVRTPKPWKTRLHITINDIKATAIARNLIVMYLLDDIAQASQRGGAEAVHRSMRSLYYIYLSYIMPPFAYDVLQTTIKRIIAALEDKSPLPSWLVVPAPYRGAIVVELKRWQKETAKLYSTSRLRRTVLKFLDPDDPSRTHSVGPYASTAEISDSLGNPSAQSSTKEEKFYFKTGILLPPSPGEDNSPPDLEVAPEIRQYFETFKLGDKTPANSDVLSRVDNTWQPNVTLIDLEWEHCLDRIAEKNKNDPDVWHNPFEWAMDLEHLGYDRKKDTLFSITRKFFLLIALGLEQFSGRLKIEVVTGEVTEILEKIRYGLVAQRSSIMAKDEVEAKATEPMSEYPSAYDRIHLSNIPDYIGGSLPIFLYALPIVPPVPRNCVVSTCLRNSPAFSTMAHFNNEYVILSKESQIEQTFQARLGKLETTDFPELRYFNWHHSKVARSLPQLMPRKEIEFWLYRLFFKTSIPMVRDTFDPQTVYSPLNLTSFLRVCSHLVQNGGYPAHWLDLVLSAIASGKVYTAGRPPRQVPLQLSQSPLPAIHQSTAPFVAEITTLLSMWRTFLPFGLTSPNLPKPSCIRKYKIVFGEGVTIAAAEQPPNVSCFVIVFLDVRFSPDWLSSSALPLASDETGTSGTKRAREEGIRVISTWDWDVKTRTGSFWLRSDVIEDMKREKTWAAVILRTDDWCPQSMRFQPPIPVGKIVDVGESWSD